jgi:hypothetical protein
LYFFLGGAPKANQYQRPRRIIHLILHRWKRFSVRNESIIQLNNWLYGNAIKSNN